MFSTEHTNVFVCRRFHRPQLFRPPDAANLPAPSEARDWAALPQDILLTVFLKLGPCEIMQGAELVCTMWRRVAVDVPLLWRSIDMGTVSGLLS